MSFKSPAIPTAQWRAAPGNTIRVRYDNEGKKKDGDEGKDKKTSGRTLFHPEGGGDSESTSSRRGRGVLSVEVSVWLKLASSWCLFVMF